jgi:uncharacterized membrane protein YesL
MQNKLFTSPLYRFLNRVADLICVSLLTLLFSIPLVTVFAAITAAHSVIQDMVFGTESTIVKKYWVSFRESFKHATTTGFILFVSLAIAMCNFICFPSQFTGISVVMFHVLFGIVLVAILTLGSIILPLIARYKNPIRQHFKNTVILCIYSPIRMLFVTFINILPLLLVIFNPAFFLYTLAFWTFMGIGIVSYLTNLLLKSTLSRLESIP